jgi:hypothetical protein
MDYFWRCFFDYLSSTGGQAYVDMPKEGLKSIQLVKHQDDSRLVLIKGDVPKMPSYLSNTVLETHLEDWAKRQQDSALFKETFGPKKQGKLKRPFSLWSFLFPVEVARSHMSQNMYGEEFVAEKIKQIITFFEGHVFSWWVKDSDDPLWIKHLLTDQGFVSIEYELACVKSISSSSLEILQDFAVSSVAEGIRDVEWRTLNNIEGTSVLNTSLFIRAWDRRAQNFFFLYPKSHPSTECKISLLRQALMKEREILFENIALFVFQGKLRG